MYLECLALEYLYFSLFLRYTVEFDGSSTDGAFVMAVFEFVFVFFGKIKS